MATSEEDNLDQDNVAGPTEVGLWIDYHNISQIGCMVILLFSLGSILRLKKLVFNVVQIRK